MAYPTNFVSLSEHCPGILIEASYSTEHNFTGEIVEGYRARKALLAKQAADSLCKVQREALSQGLTLKVFDAYRPVKAVTFFQTWAQKPETNPKIKETFYPKFSRLELFENGYIAKQSSHSRGAAIDLTLALVKTGKELDMGTAFDYFDSRSNTASPLITEDQRKNRQLLQRLMEAEGFKNYAQEWWHFSLAKEPFPGQYFDFDVE